MRYALTLCALLLWVISVFGAAATKSNDREQLTKFNHFYSLLTNLYLEDVDSEQLVESAIRATLKELDPHSVYYNSEEMTSIQEGIEGEFSGIGIEFRVLEDTIRVVNTIAGGPAERVGVMANDRIVKIDTLVAIGLTQGEVPKLLRGKAGSRVGVDVVRSGEPMSLHFSITRDKIPIHTIDAAYRLNPATGYIKVNRFGETTMTEFLEAYKSLGHVDNLVVDLRGNGGGLLSEAVEMAGFFLPKGSTVVTTKGRGVDTQILRSSKSGLFLTGDVVIIIDSASASASEIVAGALQDWDRGVIVGQRSFGKGLVQRQFPLMDGSAVRITVAQYYTPSGRAIQRPYIKGEKEAYYSNRDIDTTHSTRYRTLRLQREVYSQGGITPDVEILGDTTSLSEGYTQLIRRGIVNNYAISYLDKERQPLLVLYPSFEEFDESFAVTEDMILQILEQAKTSGVDIESIDVATLKLECELYIKALLAQRLYSTSAFYKIINSGDSLTFSSIEALLLDMPFR